MKIKILPIALIIVFALSLGACGNKVENNEKEGTAAAEQTKPMTTIPGDKAAEANAEKTAVPEETANEAKTTAEVTAAETTLSSKETPDVIQKAGYNDFIKNSKTDEPTEWTEVGSLVLTDGTYAAPKTEVTCGDKFLGWTLKSASIKNYGSDTFGIKASFDGEAAVKGTLEYNKDLSGEFENKIIFRPEEEYYSLFPRTSLDTREGIWFTIDDGAKDMLGIGDEPCEFKCEIVICEYNIFFAPMGAADNVKISKADPIE